MRAPQVSPGPAGWYADPTSEGSYRYWDGSSWSAGGSRRPGRPERRRRGFDLWLRWTSAAGISLLGLSWLVAMLDRDGLQSAWFWIPGAGLLVVAFLSVLVGGFLGLWSVPPEDPSAERERSFLEWLLGYGLIDSIGMSEDKPKSKSFGGGNGGYGGDGDGGNGGGD